MEKLPGFLLKNISKTYKARPVLSDISCHICPGVRWGILGASGSGKSTLLRLMAGLEPPDDGIIYLDGTVVSQGSQITVEARKRRISMVFQDLALWPNLTALENITLGLGRGEEPLRQARESLSMCGISEMAHRYPGELSGGEQQRLALARAMAYRPAYLFLDEPFSGLDIEIKNSIITKIKRLTADHHITTVLVSHDPLEVFTLCKKVIVLEGGRIIESGEFKSILKHTKSRLLQAFKEYVKALDGK